MIDFSTAYGVSSATASRSSVWRLVVCAIGAVLGTACAEGYPTEDEALLSPAEMNQSQRLAALNRLGQEAHLEHRWHYRLQPGCVLDVKVYRARGERLSFAVPLQDSTVLVRVDDTKRYDIQLVAAGAAQDSALTVLEGVRWAASVRVRSLLQYVQLGCREETANG